MFKASVETESAIFRSVIFWCKICTWIWAIFSYYCKDINNLTCFLLFFSVTTTCTCTNNLEWTPNEMLFFSLVLCVGLTAKWWLQSAHLSVHNRQSRITYIVLLDPKIQILIFRAFGLSDLLLWSVTVSSRVHRWKNLSRAFETHNWVENCE